MERVVDVDLFLSTQNHWAADSPHCLMILHEMFLHATSEGQKEAERMMHQGCRQYMPQLDPRVDLACHPVGTPNDWQKRAPRPLSGGL